MEHPLLEKPSGENTDEGYHSDTLLTLFRYSAPDIPLLSVAFTAGYSNFLAHASYARYQVRPLTANSGYQPHLVSAADYADPQNIVASVITRCTDS